MASLSITVAERKLAGFKDRRFSLTHCPYGFDKATLFLTSVFSYTCHLKKLMIRNKPLKPPPPLKYNKRYSAYGKAQTLLKRLIKHKCNTFRYDKECQTHCVEKINKKAGPQLNQHPSLQNFAWSKKIETTLFPD